MINRGEIFNKVQHFWKIDDKEWLEHRQAEWKQFYGSIEIKDYSARELKDLQQFFIYGTHMDKEGERIRNVTYFYKLLFTPCSSPVEFLQLVDTIPGYELQNLVPEFYSKANSYFCGASWETSLLRNLYSGLLNPPYRPLLYKYDHNYEREVDIAPRPDDYCSTFIFGTNSSIKKKKERYWLVFGFEYFLSALEFVEEERDYIIDKSKEVFERAKNVVTSPEDYWPEIIELSQLFLENEETINEKLKVIG
jgi:hypothetical protein